MLVRNIQPRFAGLVVQGGGEMGRSGTDRPQQEILLRGGPLDGQTKHVGTGAGYAGFIVGPRLLDFARYQSSSVRENGLRVWNFIGIETVEQMQRRTHFRRPS